MNKVFPSGAAAKNGDYIYFSARDFNALLRTSIVTNRTEYLCSFETEPKIERLHCKAFSYGNYVWFIPLLGESISRYNTVNGEILYYKVDFNHFTEGVIKEYCLKDNDTINIPKYLFAGWIDEKNIFLVPAGAKGLKIINLDSVSIDTIDFDIDLNTEFFGTGACCGTEVWLAPYNGEDIVIVDYISGKTRRIRKTVPIGKYYGVAACMGKFYITDNIQTLYYCDFLEETFNRIDLPIKDERGTGVHVRELLMWQNQVVLLPGNAERIFIYDCVEKKLHEKKCNFNEKLGTVQVVFSDDEMLGCLSYTEGYFLLFNSNSYRAIVCEIDDINLQRILGDNFGENVLWGVMRNGVVSEEKIGLRCFLNNI